MTAVSTRPRLRSHVHVGLRVIRKDDRTIWKVAQIWRMDRQVQLVHRDTGARLTVAWGDLYRGYECIQPYGGAL
jgi:hypothetical protein